MGCYVMQASVRIYCHFELHTLGCPESMMIRRLPRRRSATVLSTAYDDYKLYRLDLLKQFFHYWYGLTESQVQKALCCFSCRRPYRQTCIHMSDKLTNGVWKMYRLQSNPYQFLPWSEVDQIVGMYHTMHRTCEFCELLPDLNSADIRYITSRSKCHMFTRCDASCEALHQWLQAVATELRAWHNQSKNLAETMTVSEAANNRLASCNGSNKIMSDQHNSGTIDIPTQERWEFIKHLL